MTFCVEISGPWRWRPGKYSSRVMYRWWWGCMAVANTLHPPWWPPTSERRFQMTIDEEERENALIARWRRSCRDGLCGYCPACLWRDGETSEETLEEDQPENEDNHA